MRADNSLIKVEAEWSHNALKILHLSTEDISGGAARAAYRLHTGLRRLGYDSSMLVARRVSDDQTISRFMPSMDFSSRLHRRLRRARIARDFERYSASRPCEIFSDDRSEYGSDILRRLPLYDVINLHWIARFVDYEAFFAGIPRRAPIVWGLHDMNPLTGGCHYDMGCGKYREGCGACPQLGSAERDDLSSQIWKRKQKIFSSIEPGRLHIVALNHWMAAEVKQHNVLQRFPVTIIPNGVDTEVFAPRHRGFAREVLGLPQDANVVLFVAHHVNVRYKGLNLLVEAMRGLVDVSKLYLASVGDGRPLIDFPVHHLHIDRIDNDRLLSLVYSAADLLVIPSLQDNLPSTVLESMACGTPVVAFQVGGIPDMVRHRLTGLLVAPQDVEGLRTAIIELLEDRAGRAEMAANCRRIAVEEYALKLQARRYAELYQTLLK
jgi:glycosyltransferase involved in cell wall biosynthesis